LKQIQAQGLTLNTFRRANVSQSAIAEELAQLHVRPTVQNFKECLKQETNEPKTDSLLSFKCYSELVGREEILLRLDAEFEVSNIVALAGPEGQG
jgi:hypothetical protein